jgi:hypothetical protein
MNENLVIHGGDLMPASQAWPLMLEEFGRHGYNEMAIKLLLERAVSATQNLLNAIAVLSPEQRQIRLGIALDADRRAAEQWRAQWLTKEQRAAACEAQRIHWQKIEKERQAERERRYAQEREQARKEREQARNDRAKREFEAWQRSKIRQQQLKEAKLRHDILQRWQETHEPESDATINTQVIDMLMSDHDYIQWRFDVASQPSNRWMAECPIVRPAL